MCTSFIQRADTIIIGMNFDTDGFKFSADIHNPACFTVYADIGKGRYPSFGINGAGTFINNLIVDSNGKGAYRRPSRYVTHTTKLVGDVLNETIPAADIGRYLKETEVVNTPDISTHNLIADKHGNVWIVEPGRGVLYSPCEESPYYAMANFSLCDSSGTSSCGRYDTVIKMLDDNRSATVDQAFDILYAAKQNGEWKTVFSMVYSQREHAVYYCSNADFSNPHKFALSDIFV